MANLQAEHGRLRAEVAALKSRRDGLAAAIETVCDEGLAPVRAMADAVRAEGVTLAARSLSGDAARLEQDVAFARALASGEGDTWATVAAETWVGVLRCLEVWADANLVNPNVPISDEVRRVAKGIHEYVAAYGPARVPLKGLVTWLAVGVTWAQPLRSALRTLVPVGRP